MGQEPRAPKIWNPDLDSELVPPAKKASVRAQWTSTSRLDHSPARVAASVSPVFSPEITGQGDVHQESDVECAKQLPFDDSSGGPPESATNNAGPVLLDVLDALQSDDETLPQSRLAERFAAQPAGTSGVAPIVPLRDIEPEHSTGPLKVARADLEGVRQSQHTKTTQMVVGRLNETRRMVTDGRKWGHDVEIKCSLVWLTGGENLQGTFPDVNLYIDCTEPDTGKTSRRLSIRSEADKSLTSMSDTMRDFMMGLVASEQVRMEYIHWVSAPVGQYSLWVSSATTQNWPANPFEVRITIKDAKTFAVKSKQRFESIGGGEEKLAFEVDVSRSGKWRLYKVNHRSQVSTVRLCICTAYTTGFDSTMPRCIIAGDTDGAAYCARGPAKCSRAAEGLVYVTG